jgi:cytochrome c oxidase assembly protein subunit 15
MRAPDDEAPRQPVWLHRFAVFTAACVFPLIFIGGLVTSKGAGLAVPDWPNTYGYNMFLFPPSMWVGNIFYEHGHRLFASFVGLLTTILAVWLWIAEPRRWLRWLGVLAFGTVLFQGILGGLRVVLLKDQIGIFHACLAQAFFCFLVAIAFFTSRWWKRQQARPDSRARSLRWLCGIVTGIVFLQLALGATMRHSRAGLAITDFPLAYGQWVPPTDPATLEAINATRHVEWHLEPITAGQVWIHYSHRLGAVAVTAAILWLAVVVFRRFREQRGLTGIVTGLLVLLALQIFLGAWTVLSMKAADVATAHVAVGALILAGCFSATLITYRLYSPAPGGESAVRNPQSAIPLPS